MNENKIPFRTLLSPEKVIITPSGEKIEPVKAMRIDEHGNEEFYVEKLTNVYEKIQSYADSCDIEKILEACTATGDTSLLMQRKGEYMDLTDMPDNIFEANQRIKRAETLFNELPIEVRKEYDFNFNKYLKDLGSDNWLKIMGFTKEPEINTNEPEKGEETE